MKARRVAIIVARLGPYHRARLAAVGREFGENSCVVLEVAAEDREYLWERVNVGAVTRRTLIVDRDYQDVPSWELSRVMEEALLAEDPDAVAINGWGFAEARSAMAWCRRNNRVAVVMSDSQERDVERLLPVEAFKRRLVKGYDAALVGGASHAAYLVKLGMERSRIFTGYDVVDNEHFVRGAEVARQEAKEVRRAFGLPDDYFVCIARFLPKKNLTTLLGAFATYQRECGTEAFKLVLLGDGPLFGELAELRERHLLRDAVLMPGFRQYEELPVFLGLARALILPSTSEQWGLVTNEAMAAGLPVIVSKACGSAELVREGQNGYLFDPTCSAALCDLMKRLTRERSRLVEMGRVSRRTIEDYGPRSFAKGLRESIEAGEAHLLKRKKGLARAIWWR